MQRSTPNIGDALVPVEQALRGAFISALFQGLREGTPWRRVTCLTMKQAGLALPDLTQAAPKNWKLSCVITGHLVAVLRAQKDLRMADHSAYL